jgi:hypothetical protein
MAEIIKYKDWKTGEEKEYELNQFSSEIEAKTNLLCPFDNTPLLDRSYYHNEYDLFCPNCKNPYPRTRSQEEVNESAKKYVLRNKRDLKELEEKKADLEARIKHAEEVGLFRKSEDKDSIEEGDISP